MKKTQKKRMTRARKKLEDLNEDLQLLPVQETAEEQEALEDDWESCQKKDHVSRRLHMNSEFRKLKRAAKKKGVKIIKTMRPMCVKDLGSSSVSIRRAQSVTR